MDDPTRDRLRHPIHVLGWGAVVLQRIPDHPSGKDSPKSVKFCTASWRGRPVLRREQRKRELKDQWEELDDSMRHEVDSGEERDAWADESTE